MSNIHRLFKLRGLFESHLHWGVEGFDEKIFVLTWNLDNGAFKIEINTALAGPRLIFKDENELKAFEEEIEILSRRRLPDGHFEVVPLTILEALLVCEQPTVIDEDESLSDDFDKMRLTIAPDKNDRTRIKVVSPEHGLFEVVGNNVHFSTLTETFYFTPKDFKEYDEDPLGLNSESQWPPGPSYEAIYLNQLIRYGTE